MRAAVSPALNDRSSYPDSSSLPCRAIKRQKGIRYPKLAFSLTVLTLTAALGQRFYNQPGLQVDSIAPETITAPDNASVEDQDTTEELRRQARNGVLRMLQIDPTVNDKVLRSVNNLLHQLGDLRQSAGSVPFLPTNVLSTQVQTYLRSADEAEWLQVVSLIQAPALGGESVQSTPAYTNLDFNIHGYDLNPLQQRAIREIRAYGQRTSTAQVAQLQRSIAEARQSYQQALANLDLLATQLSFLDGDRRLFSLSDRDWAVAQAGIGKATNRMLAQGIAEGLPPEVLTRAVQSQLTGMVPKPAETLASQVMLSALEPNLVEDPERTRIQAEMAAEAVKPVVVTVQQNEPIVKEGEPITQEAFVLLDHFNLSQRRFNWFGLASFGVLVSGGVAVFLVIERLGAANLRQQDYLLMGVMVLSTAGLSVVGVSPYGMPAIGLLTGSFYGPLMGSGVVLLLAVLLPLGTGVGGITFIASVAGALVCGGLASRMRSREELALLGGGGGLTQGLVYLVLTLIVSPVSWAAWYGIFTGAMLQGAYGVISSIVALGLSPYLEHLFDLTTPIRLAELSNPNRPLLKRLASEAPGTFQHTLFVASLAEAAARALGCNVELVRAGTLYHDIGKMHDPLGFIENQMGGPNKHDELNDPWLSATIIKKHVTEGLVMARKCRLPKALRAFIPEHQGTMLISYFYHQAQNQAAADPTITVDEADFRYDGPIPQSPETGIVMLADSCEAALRSLTDATPEEALAMVNRILRTRWKDQQLVESGLTREHMTVIADIFVQVWQQYNHKRIAYPKAAIMPKLTS